MAWLGAQVGGTLWMVLAAVALGMQQAAWAAVPALAFLVANLAGWRIWRARARLRCLHGLWMLLAVELLASAAVLAAIDAVGVFDADREAGGNLGEVVYLYLLVFPAVALFVTWIDRWSVRQYDRYGAGKQRAGRSSGS